MVASRRGTRLPIETEFAARFDVNRHTVRRALAALTAKGLVRASAGRGTFVEDKLAYAHRHADALLGNRLRAGREAGGALLGVLETRADRRVAADLALAEGAPVVRLDTVRSADGVPISMGEAYFPLPRFRKIGAAYKRLGSVTKALAGVAASPIIAEPRPVSRRDRPQAAKPASSVSCPAAWCSPSTASMSIPTAGLSSSRARCSPPTGLRSWWRADRAAVDAGSSAAGWMQAPSTPSCHSGRSEAESRNPEKLRHSASRSPCSSARGPVSAVHRCALHRARDDIAWRVVRPTGRSASGR